MAKSKPITRVEKVAAVKEFIRSAMIPPYAHTKRVRDLTWTEARDIVFGLAGVRFHLDDSVADMFTATRDANGDIVVTPPKQPAANSAAKAGMFHIRPDVICGLQILYIDKFDKNHDIQKTVRRGHIGMLDPRFLVLLTWICERLHDRYGATKLFHLGFLGDEKHNPNDAHNWGRSFDFAGVGGMGNMYDVTVLKHWGKQPVTMPVDFGPMDPKTKTRKFQKDHQYKQWPEGFKETAYRLETPPADRFIPYVPFTDEFTDGPTWNPEVQRILAMQAFRDVYEIAATEGKDTDNKNDPPTTIGKDSRYVIHPDHHSTSLRTSHIDHIHLQVGPTVHVGFWQS
jgi:hypothetical protein